MLEFLAWHFVGKRLRDDRPIPAIGETLQHTGPLQMCFSGLHASRAAWSAAKLVFDERLEQLVRAAAEFCGVKD